MNKLITIKLVNVTYKGENIGADFYFTFSIYDTKIEIAEKIEAGTSKSFDHVIFSQSSDQDTISINLDIREDDPVYDDTASHQFSIPVGSLIGNQTHSASVKIQGQGWERKRTAILDIELKVSLDDGIRTVSDADGRGWLRIIADWLGGKETQLAYTTKVKLTKIADGREYFVIEDGPFKGKTGSVKLKGGSESYLLADFTYKPAANMLFEKSAKRLTIDGLGSFAAVSLEDPIPDGIYDIEIPSAPHVESGGPHLKDSIYAQSWFRIGHSGDKFLHCGEHSLGCITVQETKKWTGIYHFLIKCRKDRVSIGTVKVVN